MSSTWMDGELSVDSMTTPTVKLWPVDAELFSCSQDKDIDEDDEETWQKRKCQTWDLAYYGV
jgi:hypothetical protein